MPAEAEVDAALTPIIERLTLACRRRFGAGVDLGDFRLATLGGSNRTLLFSLLDGAAGRRLVLRQETMAEEYTPFLPSATQYAVVEVAHRHGVPVPEPIFELDANDDLGAGYVMAAVVGESLPKRLLHDTAFAPARAKFLQQAGAALARLHAINPAEFEVLESVADSGDPLAAQIGYYDSYGEPHPAIDLALRWLDRSRPPAPRRVPLHGDFRTGNMLVDPDEGLRAILDWECAHLGDPMADFGWFCTRSWRFGLTDRPAGGFGSRDTLYAAYEAAGGGEVDRDAARWWEVFGLMRWALYNVMQICGHVKGERRSPAFAACGRNTALVEYDLLMTMAGRFD